MSAFIQHPLASRNNRLNNSAFKRALLQTCNELDMRHQQMFYNKWVFSLESEANSALLIHLNEKITDNLANKSALIADYGQKIGHALTTFIQNESTFYQKVCPKIQKKMANKLQFYDEELFYLQARRFKLLISQQNIPSYFSEQEKRYSQHLTIFYQCYHAIIKKIYTRFYANIYLSVGIDAGIYQACNQPVVFRRSIGISPGAYQQELSARAAIIDVESAGLTKSYPVANRVKKETFKV